MEKVPQKENSREVLALVLIGVGLLWILKEAGVFLHVPFFHLENFFSPIRNAFHGIGHLIFSWPMILIIVGVVLMAGNRSGGVLLIIIGGIFLLPKLFVISGSIIVFLFPVILIAIGIALVARIL